MPTSEAAGAVTSTVGLLLQHGPVGVLTLLILVMVCGAGWLLFRGAGKASEFGNGLIQQQAATTKALTDLSGDVRSHREATKSDIDRMISEVKLSEERIKAHMSGEVRDVEGEVRAAATASGQHVAYAVERGLATITGQFPAVVLEEDWDGERLSPPAPTPATGMSPIRIKTPPRSRPGRPAHKSNPQ